MIHCCWAGGAVFKGREALPASALTRSILPRAVAVAHRRNRFSLYMSAARRRIVNIGAALKHAPHPVTVAASSVHLEGKAVIVTGGGTGIGQGIALALAAEGCHVIVTGRRVEPLQDTVKGAAGLAGTVEAFAADVVERDQSQLIQHVVEKYGRLDILVNNAGTNIPKRSLKDMSLDDWHKVIDTNLHGTYHVVHAALPQMRAQQDGLIINVTSISGKRTISDLAGSAYCASKFAMESLGQAINLEEHENGIRCTNLAPGEVVTGILDQRPEPPSEERRQMMLQPEDVAAAVLMVARMPPVAHVTEIVMTGKTTVLQAVK